MDEVLLRSLTPTVLAILVRRGADFAAAEDAVQDALVEAVRVWPTDPPRDPRAWLVTVAWRRFLDAARAHASRRQREQRTEVVIGDRAVDDRLGDQRDADRERHAAEGGDEHGDQGAGVRAEVATQAPQ